MLYPSLLLPCLPCIAKSLWCFPLDAAVLAGGVKLHLQIVLQPFGVQSPVEARAGPCCTCLGWPVLPPCGGWWAGVGTNALAKGHSRQLL